MKSIPTLFNGTEYRSRLEAKWAAYFDLIKWPATYEPFDADGYFPDFVIRGPEPLLIEIKPAVTEAEYRAPIDKMTAGLTSHWAHDILILGADPLPQIDACSSWWPPAGLLGERMGCWDCGLNDPPDHECPPQEWDFGIGAWARCGRCGGIGVHHSVQSFHHRPCGHHEGGGNQGPADVDSLRGFWAEATNAVKWGGR